MKTILAKKITLIVFFLMIFCAAAINNLAVTELDISYVTDGNTKQKLDLFLPDTKNFATVLLIHGGSLVEGDRKDEPFPQICAAFQKSGIGCAVMSYRLGPENKWAAQPEDVSAAFAWLKQNIVKRGGDDKKLFVLGHSSGALLTALLGTDEKYLKLHNLTLKDIAGCIPIGSLLTNTFNFENLSKERLDTIFKNNSYLSIFGSLETLNDSIPINHVNKDMPPFLILVAEAERLQPPILASAEEFAAAAQKVGAKVEIEVLKDRTHYATINKMVETNDPTLLRIIQFIKAQRA
ncbi:MAG TPA: alpha/beta hydrolase [Pyrinomonadaceae bacterium]|nr:alpha/beta hydrolase [Pyrinomonadaceae bacterium]